MSDQSERSAFSIDFSGPLWLGRACPCDVTADAERKPDPEEPEGHERQNIVIPAHRFAMMPTYCAGQEIGHVGQQAVQETGLADIGFDSGDGVRAALHEAAHPSPHLMQGGNGGIKTLEEDSVYDLIALWATDDQNQFVLDYGSFPRRARKFRDFGFDAIPLIDLNFRVP